MHYLTKQLHASQKLCFSLEGETRIRCELYEKGRVKLSRALTFRTRGERARAIHNLESAVADSLYAVKDGAPDSSVAAIFYHILNH